MPARYLLRLGMGEAELETDLDFSRVGRVNAMLARRLELLAEVRHTVCWVRCAAVVDSTMLEATFFWLPLGLASPALFPLASYLLLFCGWPTPCRLNVWLSCSR